MTERLESNKGQVRRIIPARLMALVLFLVVTSAATFAQAGGFGGNFKGISTAAGMSLALQEVEGRLVGRLVVSDGRSFALNGARREVQVNSAGDETAAAGAQGELRIGSSPQAVAFFRIEERPLGVQFLFIPVTGGGKPDMTKARDYSFLRQGVSLPAAQSAASSLPTGKTVDLLAFIDGYRNWPPADVAKFYNALNERDKGLVQIYDHASADVLWRVCSSNPPHTNFPQASLDEILDRQQTDCSSLLPLVKQAEASGLFAEFLRRARFQFEVIREMALCDRGQSSPTTCADVSALGAPLIAHWRDARSIMQSLLPEGTQVATAPVANSEKSSSKKSSSEIAPSLGEKQVPQARPDTAGMARLPLRASLADDGMSDEVQELSIKNEGRSIAKMRRSGLYLPLRNPRT
jgi:hypothetical protein